MTSQSNKDDLKKAVNQAASQGVITPGSQKAIIDGLEDNIFPAVIGDPVDQLATTYPSLVMFAGDASGSMGIHQLEMIRALNFVKEFVAKQSDSIGFEALLSLMTFDDTPRQIRPFRNVSEMTDFDDSDYRIGGLTNLLGAIHKAITDTLLYGTTVFSAGATGYQQFVIVFSDGFPEGPQSKTHQEAKDLIAEFSSKPNAAVIFCGFGDEKAFSAFAQSLGIANIRVYDPTDPDWFGKMAFDLSSSISHHSQRASQGLSYSGDFFVTN